LTQLLKRTSLTFSDESNRRKTNYSCTREQNRERFFFFSRIKINKNKKNIFNKNKIKKIRLTKNEINLYFNVQLYRKEDLV
jgi:hypothetical protein